MLDLVLISSLTTGAVVRFCDVFASISETRQLLNRDPDFIENGMISWGNVEMHELERIMMDSEDPDPEGFERISTLSREYAGEEYFWSIFYNEEEHG